MTDRAQQQEIIEELQVVQEFDAERETERRIGFLVDYLRTTGLKGYVLGISGGVDSSTAGRLAQLACERARASREYRGRWNSYILTMSLPTKRRGLASRIPEDLLRLRLERTYRHQSASSSMARSVKVETLHLMNPLCFRGQ